MKMKFSKVVALVLAMAMVMVIGAVPAMAEDAGTGGTVTYPAFSAPYTETFDWVGDTWEDPDDTDGSFTDAEQIGEYNTYYATYNNAPLTSGATLPNGMVTGKDYTSSMSSVIFTNDGMYLDAYRKSQNGTNGYATVIVPEVAGLESSYKVSATFQKMLYGEGTTTDQTFNPRPYIRAAISADENSYYELRLNANDVTLRRVTPEGNTSPKVVSLTNPKTKKINMELAVYPEGNIIFNVYADGKRIANGTYTDSDPIAVDFAGETPTIPAAVGVYSQYRESVPVKFSEVSVTNNVLTLTEEKAVVKDASGVVMFASYDANGKLIQANYAETTGGDVPVNVTLEGAKTLKAMLWESTTSIKPLCNVEKITLN